VLSGGTVVVCSLFEPGLRTAREIEHGLGDTLLATVPEVAVPRLERIDPAELALRSVATTATSGRFV
jgi:hypothetical protein